MFSDQYSLIGREENKLLELRRFTMDTAICHLELSAREAGLSGGWEIDDPGIATPQTGVEYTATWRIGPTC